MSKETRALTTIGGKVQETKSVAVNASTLSSKQKDKNKDKGKGKNTDSSAKKGTDGKKVTSAAVSASQAQAVHGKDSVKKMVLSGLAAVVVIGVSAAIAFSFYQGNMTIAKSTETDVAEQNSEHEAAQVSRSGYSDEELSIIASRENVGLPRMVDKDTRLDFTVGVSDSFQYNYTLINNNSEDITYSSLTSNVEKSLVKWVCTTKSTLEKFIKKGVTVSFAYFGRDRRLIGVITVEPSQCAVPNSGP